METHICTTKSSEKKTSILACIHNYAIKTAAFASLFSFISFVIFLRLPTAQPHIPVLPPDAHVLSGKTYSAIPHLNIRLRRDLNRDKCILDTVNCLDNEKKKVPYVSRT